MCDLFLSWSSPAYDQLAADNRYLAETGLAGAQSWSSTPSGLNGRLNSRIGKQVTRFAGLPFYGIHSTFPGTIGTGGSDDRLMAAVSDSYDGVSEKSSFLTSLRRSRQRISKLDAIE